MRLIDTHCHLNFKAFKKDLDNVIKQANLAGVEKIIIPGAKIHSSKLGVEIANKYENTFASVGIHPHHALEEINIEEIKILAQNVKVVAIGEIGLDHHQYKNYPPLEAIDKKKQVAIFTDQLKIAVDLNKPVIIHCREAQKLILETLKNFIKNFGKIRGVFHCFEGDEEFLEQVLSMGFYIGIDGNITYPETKHLRNVVKNAAKDRLLIETDAPFLTPQNYRGTRNEPKHLVETLEYLSHFFNIDLIDLADMTTQNSEKLFFS